MKNYLRDLLEGAEALAANETELLLERRDLVLRRRELVQSKASYVNHAFPHCIFVTICADTAAATGKTCS